MTGEKKTEVFIIMLGDYWHVMRLVHVRGESRILSTFRRKHDATNYARRRGYKIVVAPAVLAEK